jgi:hypothetical protein
MYRMADVDPVYARCRDGTACACEYVGSRALSTRNRENSEEVANCNLNPSADSHDMSMWLSSLLESRSSAKREKHGAYQSKVYGYIMRSIYKYINRSKLRFWFPPVYFRY